jgi:hypothetical protein
LAHIVATKTSDQIIATIALETTAYFNNIVAFLILIVAPLTSSPVKNNF